MTSSYLERSISTFFKEKIFDGFRIIVEKKILPFSILIFGVLFLNIGSIFWNYILNQLVINNIDLGVFEFISNWSISNNLIREFIYSGLFIAIGFVISGLVSAIWKNFKFQVIIISIFVIISLLIGLSIQNHLESNYYQIMKIIFLLIWIINTSFSLFTLFLYFFTSFGGKILMMGKSDDHIFLGIICFIGGILSLIISIVLLVLYSSLSVLFIGPLGILSISMYLILFIKTKKDKSSTNFLTILGFYNFYILYQLSKSLFPSQDIGNFTIDLIILIIITLFSIQRAAQNVKSIDTSQLESIKNKRSKFFQKKLNIFPRIKLLFGDFSLTIVSLGLSLGYILVVISDYIDPNLSILGTYFNSEITISLLTARMYSFINLIIFLCSIIMFKSSEKFRELVTNNYTLKKGVEIAGDIFKSWGKRIKSKLFNSDDENSDNKDSNYEND